MAVTEIKEALRSAADTVAKYVRDAAELKVETKIIVVGSDQDPSLAASMVIKLDGGNVTSPRIDTQARLTPALRVSHERDH